MTYELILEQLENNLGSIAENIFPRNTKRIYMDIPPEHNLRANRYVYEDLNGRLATATGMDTPDHIEVLYHYCIDPLGIVVTLRTWAQEPDYELMSVATIFPGANFIEREIQDLLGIRFIDHPDPRRLLLADDWPEGVYPLRREHPTRRDRRETPEFFREIAKEVTTQ